MENRPAPEKLPLELFATDIKANKLEDDKWAATIKDSLLQHMPTATNDAPSPPPGGDSGSGSDQIMHR